MHRLHDPSHPRQILGQLVRDVMGLARPSRSAPIRVLVVDDEPEMLEFIARVVETADYRVTTAGNGAEAIAEVGQHGAPDLLLTDVKMPQMSGDELAGRLRRSIPDLKVLYLTGFSEALFGSRGTLWEGEAFLEKPCSPAALLDGVSMLLHGHPMGTTAGPARQAFTMRTLLGGLAKNSRRDVV